MGILKDILRKVRECFTEFQGCFFKDVSRKFHESVMCMNLIAAPRAEGGLV